MNDDNIICDKCDNYAVSLDGTRTTCWAFVFELKPISVEYTQERMNGTKKKCKCFRLLDKHFASM